MRTGRPAFHIKAHWITIDIDGKSVFYQLDGNGRLIRKNGRIEPHHETSYGNITGTQEREVVTRIMVEPPSAIVEYTHEEKNNVATERPPDPPPMEFQGFTDFDLLDSEQSCFDIDWFCDESFII